MWVKVMLRLHSLERGHAATQLPQRAEFLGRTHAGAHAAHLGSQVTTHVKSLPA